MERLEKLLRERHPLLELRVNEPMAKHTTFRIGGPAALMVLPKSVDEVKMVLKDARELEIQPFFLGNGSNLLVADQGYPGLVVKLTGEFENIFATPVSPSDGIAHLLAGGSVLLSRLSRQAQERGLTGLEFAQGIPGSVGGAVTMNAGAYGGEMSQVLLQVAALGPDGRETLFSGENCDLSYRHSRFSNGDWLITQAVFGLSPGDPEEIASRMQDFARRRQAKQPLEYPSAGSIFKRPPGHFAAALIDQCGLKGLTVGGAQVSEKHAGFVVNRGGATCTDVLELVRQVKERVLKQTGVELEMEVKVLK